MSLNRENVTWQSPVDEKWYQGFFAYDQYGDDHEWDVDYDMGRFNWASGPHDSSVLAVASWTGCNPGQRRTVAATDSEAVRLDQMFQEFIKLRPGAIRPCY